MKGQPGISPIYSLGAQSDDRDPLEQWGRIEAMRRRVWRDCGIVAVDPNELPAELAGHLKSWAEQHYGKR